MSLRRLTLLALLALTVQTQAASAAPCLGDPAQGLRPCELEVVGGEETWRADSLFNLSWRNPPQSGAPPVAAVHYRVLDASLQVMRENSVDRAAETLEVFVPTTPGIYTVEVRLEDAAGNLGPAATASLRFDNSRPGRVEPLPSANWIGRTDLPYALRLSRPTGPEPISGIRGYAIAIDHDPCLAANRCTEAETSLRGGREDDTLLLSALPEGTSYAHAVAVSGAGMGSASVGRTMLRVDTTAPLTTLSGAPNGWTNRPVELLGTASDAASGMAPAGPAGPFTAIRIDGGAPIAVSDDSVRARVIGAGVHTVAHYARDAAGNVDDGGVANGSSNPPPATATVRIDPEPPRIVFSGAQDPADPEAIEARVFDSLSGPSRQRGRIEVRRAGSGDRFEPLPTSVGDGELRARWESESYSPGPYEFRATGFDLAGNEATTLSRPNGSRMVLSAPLKGATELRLRLGRGGAMLRGQLSGGRGRPLAGMTVRVIERFDPGSGQDRQVSTVRTGQGGDFALRLPPGPCREIVASFTGTVTLARSQSDPVRLSVPGAVRMRASKAVAQVGGRPVVFSGRVAGEIPPGGKYVQLQFRLPRLPWTEFRTVRTDARGRFRYAYRFSDDDSRGVRFQFRAFAPAQDDWPYEPAGSRPVAVRGR
ncbi:MAG TPA: carboxypeptidase-like regulatory domain-containing protein [Solirubrobacterales bacterium]|nr:carboxypeptidase-like regulatory domain-containing protein [Solirubrobacterales bacterium]